MMHDAPLSEKPTPLDIINAYRLALGRDPESQSVIEETVIHAGPDWLKGFFTSPEFHANVRDTVLRGIRPVGAGFAQPPQDSLTDWAADQLPLQDASRVQVRNATEWPDLFTAIFADQAFSAAVLELEPESRDWPFLEALERLAAMSYIKAGIEFTSEREVRGWALDTRNPGRRLALELRFGDVFAGAAVPSIFRRDLQERFGGGGEYGFVLRFSTAASHDHSVSGELRDVASNAVLATVQLPPTNAASTELIAAVRRELVELRAAAARIEERLPAISVAASFSVESYDEYFMTYYRPREAAVAAGAQHVDLAVFVLTRNGNTSFLDRTLASLERQSARPREIVIGYDNAAFRLEVEYLSTRYQARFGNLVKVSAVLMNGLWKWQAQEASVTSSSHRLIFLREPVALAPQACAAMVAGLDRGAALLFADDDLIEEDVSSARERHVSPRLRSCFDADLFLQEDYLGPILAIRRDLLDQLGNGDGVGLNEIVFRALECGGEADIAHLPQVLAHRLSDVEEGGSVALRTPALERYLRFRGSEATIEPHSDPLGVQRPGALHVRYALRAKTRATVVIPTRDRPDLLGPCLASIAASRSGSDVELDVIVVDNQSDVPPSRDLLESFPELAIRVMEHDGAFNWALINNRAAENTNADVLIFLNDDTVVLSPNSIDELCRHALRDEVGAVGARLLYEDGTIQHAGVVLDPWHSFATHEGVGAASSEAGYLGRHTLVRQSATVTGACLATRSALFAQTGGFDFINFPIEGNDTDYCLRLRSLGYRIIYNPYATFYHFESKSRGFNVDEVKRQRAFRATQVLRKRWAERFENDLFYNPHFDRLSAPFSRLQPPPPEA